MARAEIAMRFVAGLGIPPASFVQRRSFLEDLQILHEMAHSK
jgi:hypothetical protein